jgi:hypothetical protein
LGCNKTIANVVTVEPIFLFLFYLAKAGNGCANDTVERKGAMAFAARFNASLCFMEQLLQRF